MVSNLVVEIAIYNFDLFHYTLMDNDNDKDKAGEEEKKTRAGPLLLPGPSPTVWVTTGSKVAPQNSQQVNKQDLLN